MKRVITILATAVLTSTLIASTADARRGSRGFGGGGHMGSFSGGVQMRRGFGGSRGDGGENALRGSGPRYDYGHGPSCYYPGEAPKAPPWPPFCS